ncbi:MAG: hypothetical protein ACYC9Q_08625 [Bacillota bacterium]
MPERTAGRPGSRSGGVGQEAAGEPIERLLLRLRTLEDQVQSLRFSRRVLMDLLVAMDRERRAGGSRLETENQRLRQDNRRMARLLQVRGGGSGGGGSGGGDGLTDP